MSIHILAAPLKNNPGVSQNLINQKKIHGNRRQASEFLCDYFSSQKNTISESVLTAENLTDKISLCYSDTSVFCAFNSDNNLINIDAERPVIPSSSLIYFYRKFADFHFKIKSFNKNSLTRLWTLYEAIFKLLNGKQPTGEIIGCLLQSGCHTERYGNLYYGKFNISWRTFAFLGHWVSLVQLNNNLNARLSPIKLYYINSKFI